MKERLQELKDQGKTVYSFSRLGTMNNCEYEYYNTYMLKNRGIENIYTVMGSSIHDGTESLYKGEMNPKDFKESVENKLIESELLGITFPSDKIGDSWKADVNHFLANFKKIDKKAVLEKLIVFEVSDGIYFQGYVDAIMPSDKGKPYIDVVDWKTSSKFTGKKLTEAGRQLLLYNIGLDQVTNVKVDKVVWFMIKYVYVCSQGKKAVKKKMCNRGKWVKEIRNQLHKLLEKSGVEDFEVEILLDKAVEDNNLSCLPKEIQEQYWLEDCMVEYDITDEKINEVKEYVVDTVQKIENKNPSDESEWKPKKIDKYDSFYCSVLCGHRKTCRFYKEFLDNNSNDFTKKKKDDDFDLFG